MIIHALVNSLPEGCSRIFLLSHMRAFTSLAGHIIGSHPEVNGYFEMHLSYEDASSFDKQLDIFLQGEALKVNSRYLFDKLLHNDYLLKLEQGSITNIPEVKILLSLREPEPTIKSIVNLFAQKQTDELYASPVEATKYYIERVTALADFCRTCRQGYYFFDAAMLQTAPEVLLPKLTHWLELDTPLTESYEIFSQTGEAGKGDSSSIIQSGKISQTKNDYSQIRIPDEQLSDAIHVYHDCRRQIMGDAIDSAIN